jgi:hypothetical protein
MSWVIRITETPRRACSALKVSSTWRWMITSSAVTGSSAITSAGSSASASAIAAGWRMPPLNWCG